MFKKMCVALFLAAIICVPLCSVRAVSNGELELDGQMEEYDIWDFSHNVALYETGILSAPVAVTYADLKYLIDDNRKTLYLYIRLIDETPPSDGACGVCLSLADGSTIRLDEDVRPSAPTCAQVSYYALELRDTEMIFEAQIDFYTIAEAKEALESLSVSVFDRRGRETQGYCFTPVFPVQPGETQSVPAAAESTDRDEKETDSRRESTTKKPSTTRDKSTTRKSGKSSSRDPEDPEEEETEEEALDHTVSYTVESRSDSDYRVMIVAVVLLLVALAAAGIISLIISFVKKRRVSSKVQSGPEEEKGTGEEPTAQKTPDSDPDDRKNE